MRNSERGLAAIVSDHSRPHECRGCRVLRYLHCHCGHEIHRTPEGRAASPSHRRVAVFHDVGASRVLGNLHRDIRDVQHSQISTVVKCDRTQMQIHHLPLVPGRVERYIQADPIGLRGGLNVFSYVLDNPTEYIDPLGGSFVFLAIAMRTSTKQSKTQKRECSYWRRPVHQRARGVSPETVCLLLATRKDIDRSTMGVAGVQGGVKVSGISEKESLSRRHFQTARRSFSTDVSSVFTHLGHFGRRELSRCRVITTTQRCRAEQRIGNGCDSRYCAGSITCSGCATARIINDPMPLDGVAMRMRRSGTLGLVSIRFRIDQSGRRPDHGCFWKDLGLDSLPPPWPGTEPMRN